MNNFQARTITGLSLVFILLATLAAGKWVFAALLTGTVILGLLEFYKLLEGSCHPWKYYGIMAGILLYFSISFIALSGIDDPLAPYALLLPLVLLFMPVVLEVFAKKENPVLNVSSTIFSLIYIPLPLSLLNFMTTDTVAHWKTLPVFLFGYLILIWGFDTVAYLFGKQFGKHKFMERISPRKTWEGTIAGFLVACLITVALYLLFPAIRLPDWIALMALVVVFGILGDLAESLFKRSLNIKDSGTVLPGHGGILDRFDSILVSSPFVFTYFVLRFLI